MKLFHHFTDTLESKYVSKASFGYSDDDQQWALVRYHWGAMARLSSRMVRMTGTKGVKV